MLAAQTRQLQQGSDLVLQGRRIGALQYFGALRLDFGGLGAVHAPALAQAASSRGSAA